MTQKRIMILGGNIVQAEATRTARRLGYYTISTDVHPDNPGHAIADEYCNVDVIDREAVLREAHRLNIDGIIPYASDVLAPVAAYVAEALGLPGNPSVAVETLTHKNRFREFLINNGFPAPRGKAFCNMEEAAAFFNTLDAPAMMKPVDNAGSKGVFKVESAEDIRLHWQESMGYSMEGTVLIEEFIERQGLQQDGDIFVIDGRIAFWGLGDQHRDMSVAPFVPVAHTFPSTMPENYRHEAQTLVQRILSALNFRQGPCNVEYIVDKKGRVFIMEIGPRNGGNLIPQALQEATGTDFTALTLRQAVGEEVEISSPDYKTNAATVVLHAHNDGILRGVDIAPEYRQNQINAFMFRNPGDTVRRFHNAGDAIGTMTFRFDDRDRMLGFIENGVTISLA